MKSKAKALKSKIILILVSLITIFGCQSPELEFENKSKSCRLELYKNNTYSFSYPIFLKGTKKEKGIFERDGDKLTLTREVKNDLPNVDVSYICSEENPKMLVIDFKNLDGQIIDLKFNINNSSNTFTSESGKTILAYKELEGREILEKNGLVENLMFQFEGNEYESDLIGFNNSRRPNRLVFVLNEFKGKRTALLNRRYLIQNDSILMNDISPKSIGTKNRYLIKN